MSDPKDTQRDELTNEQLDKASGGGSTPSQFTGKPEEKPFRPGEKDQELSDGELGVVSGGGRSQPGVGDEDPLPLPPVDSDPPDSFSKPGRNDP